MPMKQVRFFSLREDGYHYTGRNLLGTEGIEFDGLPDHFQEQLRKGVVEWTRPRQARFPKDGITFMEAVVKKYGHGAYFKAHQIEDVDS